MSQTTSGVVHERAIETVPLTHRDRVKIDREETPETYVEWLSRTQFGYEITDETTEQPPRTWGALVKEWETYCEETEELRLVFTGATEENQDEVKTVPYTHRFQEGRKRMWYAKILDFARGAQAEYENCWSSILTFSTSTTDAIGGPRPPIDHLEELLVSWERIYYELNQVMNGSRQRNPYDPSDDRPEYEPREWEYLWILEPTTDRGHVPGGYAHAHLVVVADGPIDDGRLESVVDTHVRNCEGALGEAHEFEDTVVIKEPGELESLGAYVAKYLGAQFHADGWEAYEKRFNALLWETGRRRVRSSEGAQRWMQRAPEESEAGRWEFAGVADEKMAGIYENLPPTRVRELLAGPGDDMWLERLRMKGELTEQALLNSSPAAHDPMKWEDRPPPDLV